MLLIDFTMRQFLAIGGFSRRTNFGQKFYVLLKRISIWREEEEER